MMHPEPYRMLRAWLPGNDDPVRPPMTLATVDADGLPDARTVLLSAVDDDGGLHLHTDARSRKVAQLTAHPAACLVVPLPDSGRQLVVRGPVERVDPDAAGRAYRRRTRYLQVLAWVNTGELAQRSPDVRQRVWKEFEEGHAGELGPPPTWVGYRVRPERVTFWTADAEGPSTRVEYHREGTTWRSERLPG